MMKRIGELKAERIHDLNQIGGLQEENARLKAEVERLEKTEEYLQNTLNQYALDDMRLQAQVERLTKAGDELHAFLINYIVEGRISSSYLNKLDDDWNAANEGKAQS
jgi:predicted RNase H-like nuclease (RuvC/YqgF family)